MLCENPWNGGRGYTPNEVAEFTPDQIYFLLCDANVLKRKEGRRTKAVPSASGKLKGRTADGELIELEAGGKTMLQIVQEREAAKKRRGRRRRKR
jgi:hypothetical protein